MDASVSAVLQQYDNDTVLTDTKGLFEMLPSPRLIRELPFCIIPRGITVGWSVLVLNF